MQNRSNRIEGLINHLMANTPQVESQRAMLITAAYQASENQAPIIRRAKALQNILENMTVVIRPNELIVGNLTTTTRGSSVFPEFSNQWLEAEFDRIDKRSGDVFKIDEQTKKELSEAFTYWQGKTTNEFATALMSSEAIDAMNIGVFTVGNYYFNGVGHISVDYQKVLEVGLKGIQAEAKAELEALPIGCPKSIEKEQFLKGVLIATDAVITYAHRLAKLAKEQAASCEDATRKAELEVIAKNLQRVPEYPAESFYEALQSFWIIHAVIQIESNGHSISPMRFDQYVYPFYQKSVEQGSLPASDAQELLDCLWVKFNDINKVRDESSTKAFGGYPMFQNLIVGGQDKTGADATNALSYACLVASEHTRLPQPSISMRVWNESPEDLLTKAAEVSRLGLGIPAYYNDEVIIPALTNRGVSLEDARDYGIIGCVEPQCGGKTEGWHDAAFFNIPKVLEITLNNGYVDGQKVGLQTGALETFTTFESLEQAFELQMNYFVSLMVNADNAVDVAHGKRAPLPFLSSMVDNCIKSGRSLQEGGAKYNFTGPQGVGIANAGDALTAIKQLVFEEQKLSLSALKQALDTNFGKDNHAENNPSEVDGQYLRQMLLNGAPKFGNDIDSADQMVRKVALVYCEEVQKYQNPRGGAYQPGLYPASANVPLGAATLASADGRYNGEPLADGVSPISGYDKNGPTAAMNSVAKLDHEIASNGTLLNQKFHPSALAGEAGLANLSALVRSYFAQKGMHVQFNVISRDILIDAQNNPDKYRNLVVRVAGYSAHFVSLDKTIQEDIIARTEQLF